MGEEKLIQLDTDVITEVLEKKSGMENVILRRIIESGEECCTSSVNMHELLYCLQKYSKDSHLVRQIPTPGYDKNDSELSAVLELSAERNGSSVPRMDAIVASVAINNGCSVYTLDEGFEVFTDKGLKLFS